MLILAGMFIREVEKENGSISVRIVKSVRKGDKVSQVIVRRIGQAKFEHELKGLRVLAEQTIIHMKNLENPVLPGIDPEGFYGSTVRKREVPEDVRLRSLKEIKRLNQGVSEVLGKAYEQLELNEVVVNTNKDDQWNEILRSCVLARVMEPASKLKTVDHLSRHYALDIPLEKVYRMMDRLNEERVKTLIGNATLRLFDDKVNILLFDVTTLYFESIETDELRDFGFSKDCKFKESQIVLALVTNERGHPVTYEILPGNMYEGSSLIKVITGLKARYNVALVHLVADRAMFSSENLDFMDNEGITYIVAARLKSLHKKLKTQLLTDEFSPTVIEDEFHWVKEYEHQNRRLLVGYSSSRARKDKADRERLLERLLRKVKDGKIRIGEIVTNRGTKKYLKPIQGHATVDTEKIQQDEKWDGLHGVITNSPNSIEDIMGKYRGLWRIEEAFRINKHNLKMRPIFHWKPERIRAHIGICFLAYSVVKYLEFVMRKNKIQLSLEQIKEELSNDDYSLLRDNKTNKLYGLPSQTTSNLKRIYQAFDLQRSESPFALN